MHGIFALLVRTLRQDSRHWQSGVVRAALLLFLLTVLVLMTRTPVAASGLAFVSWMLWLSYASITLAGFYWFASPITEEKEQRSLGLLRMTGLNGVAILAGKWFPRLLIVLLLISTQFPLALLGVTLGGVLPRQLLAGFVALLAYAVMMSGVGLLASTVSQTTQRAGFFVGWFWFSLTFLPSLAMRAITAASVKQNLMSFEAAEGCYRFYDSVREISLWHRLTAILSIMPDESLWDVQVWSNLLIGFVAFGLAWVVFEFFAVYNLEVVAKAAPKDRLINRIFGQKKQHDKRHRTRFAVGRVWRVAPAWREFHFNAGGWITVVAKFLIYGSVPIAAYFIGVQLGMSRTDPIRFISGALMIIGGTAAMGEAVFYSGRMFGPEVYENTLPSLLLLPTSTTRIAYAKVGGFLLAMLPAAVCFLLGCIINPRNAAEFFGRFSVLGSLYAVSGFLTFLYMSVFLSIHTRAGVLVTFILLIASIILFNVVAFTLTRSVRNTDVMAIIPLLIMWSTICVLHFRIGKSLKTKAAA
jgi:hypothetical protein